MSLLVLEFICCTRCIKKLSTKYKAEFFPELHAAVLTSVSVALGLHREITDTGLVHRVLCGYCISALCALWILR